jgi:hypothetical protein
MTLTFSRYLAIVFGILTPLAETVRRWHQLAQWEMLPFWLDDYILGTLLLYGAWRTGRDAREGQRFLAAGWGFTCGMAYGSFFGQLANLDEPDPAPIATEWVVAIKGVGLALAVFGLVACLRPVPDTKVA